MSISWMKEKAFRDEKEAPVDKEKASRAERKALMDKEQEKYRNDYLHEWSDQ